MNNHQDNEYFFKTDVTFSIRKGLFYSVIASFLWMVIHFFILFIIHKHTSFIQLAFDRSIFFLEYFIIVFFAGIIVQELIKSVILFLKAKIKWNNLKAGFSMVSLMPYVMCKYPIPIKIYRLTLILPTIIIMQTIWLAYFFNLYEFIVINAFWLLFSMFEFITYFKIKNYQNEYLATTHTTLPGAVIYDNPFNE